MKFVVKVLLDIIQKEPTCTFKTIRHVITTQRTERIYFPTELQFTPRLNCKSNKESRLSPNLDMLESPKRKLYQF